MDVNMCKIGRLENTTASDCDILCFSYANFGPPSSWTVVQRSTQSHLFFNLSRKRFQSDLRARCIIARTSPQVLGCSCKHCLHTQNNTHRRITNARHATFNPNTSPSVHFLAIERCPQYQRQISNCNSKYRLVCAARIFITIVCIVWRCARRRQHACINALYHCVPQKYLRTRTRAAAFIHQSLNIKRSCMTARWTVTHTASQHNNQMHAGRCFEYVFGD